MLEIYVRMFDEVEETVGKGITRVLTRMCDARTERKKKECRYCRLNIETLNVEGPN